MTVGGFLSGRDRPSRTTKYTGAATATTVTVTLPDGKYYRIVQLGMTGTDPYLFSLSTDGGVTFSYLHKVFAAATDQSLIPETELWVDGGARIKATQATAAAMTLTVTVEEYLKTKYGD